MVKNVLFEWESGSDNAQLKFSLLLQWRQNPEKEKKNN